MDAPKSGTPSLALGNRMKTFLLTAALALLAAWVPGGAQAENNGGTTIVTLGTRGGPRPTPDRAQSSNLLVVDGTLYLIDAGDGVARNLVGAGYDFTKVGKIFITHAHSDHMAGLAALLVSEWDFTRREPVDVYGSGAEAIVAGALAFLKPDEDIRWNEGKKTPMATIFHGHDIAPGVIYQDDKVRVTAVENTHFHFAPGDPAYRKYRSFSYRFDTPGRIVVFTGDTGPSDAVTTLAKDADVLVTEVGVPDEVIAPLKRAGLWDMRTPDEQQALVRHLREEHMRPEDVGKLATSAGVKLVVMTHLGLTAEINDDYQRYVEAAKAFYSGPIVVAKDMMKF